jgi:hypothetical protein
MLRAMNLLADIHAESHPPPMQVGWKEYVSAVDPRLVATDDAMSELSRFTASLTMVDGAVVLTHELEAIGFGAEISGELPDVSMVARVVDFEAQKFELEPATAMGTRHRSAYRLCKAPARQCRFGDLAGCRPARGQLPPSAGHVLGTTHRRRARYLNTVPLQPNPGPHGHHHPEPRPSIMR